MIRGICPNCGEEKDIPLNPCQNSVCIKKGYHYIPKEWYFTALEFAKRRNKPFDPYLGRYLDKYLLAGKLGEGGMGVVYLAIQRPLGQQVALKVISGVEMTESQIARFEREARAISLLDHPNIVKIYDYGIGTLDTQVPYMALEYIRHGQNLKRCLNRVRDQYGGVIPKNVILVIFRQILNALHSAHKVGVIHRDMKPENVMVTSVEGNPYFVKILDFGLAKTVYEMSGTAKEVSLDGYFLGTPYYMAPEQIPISKVSNVDGRADLYAVAVMIYETFTGERLYDGEGPMDIMLKKTNPNIKPMLSVKALMLPNRLRQFLEKGIAIDPEKRFGTAEEMLFEFEDTMKDIEISGVGLLVKEDGSSKEKPMTPPSTDAIPKVVEFVEVHLQKPQRVQDNKSAKKRGTFWPYIFGPLAGMMCLIGLYAVFLGSNENDEVNNKIFDVGGSVEEVQDIIEALEIRVDLHEELPIMGQTIMVATNRRDARIVVNGIEKGRGVIAVTDVRPQDILEIEVRARGCKIERRQIKVSDVEKNGRVFIELICTMPKNKKDGEKIEML